MKFRVSVKDPDVLHDAIDDALKKEEITAEDADEREMIIEHRKEKLHELCSTWFEYSEYLTVEIDTEAKTCVVVPRKSS